MNWKINSRQVNGLKEAGYVWFKKGNFVVTRSVSRREGVKSQKMNFIKVYFLRIGDALKELLSTTLNFLFSAIMIPVSIIKVVISLLNFLPTIHYYDENKDEPWDNIERRKVVMLDEDDVVFNRNKEEC